MSHKSYPPLQPEEWLVQRLENLAQSDPHFEASWYGAYNALLSHYFPYQRCFLIKPQPRLRDMYEGDISFSSVQAESSMAVDLEDEDSFGAGFSVTSLGALALAGADTYIPDFIVTKATQYATHDTALLIVEVKVDEPSTDAGWFKPEHQMDEYLDSLSMQISGGTPLAGLLICATKVKIYRLQGPGSSIKMDKEMYSINSDNVRELLRKIAIDNWD